MFELKDDYTARVEKVGDTVRYLISFTDSEGKFHETEISYALFEYHIKYNRSNRKYKRRDERYMEYSKLSNEQLYERAANKPKKIEDLVLLNLDIDAVFEEIENLSALQRKRFELYIYDGLTLKEISVLENCTISSVHRSIERAKEKIIKKLKG
ncbi:MAG: hypothetical protein FWF50_01365 [Defluviitaleaceae bacterium]|nr:hypothetical protein [Defluviitaleaceae bacterium]